MNLKSLALAACPMAHTPSSSTCPNRPASTCQELEQSQQQEGGSESAGPGTLPSSERRVRRVTADLVVSADGFYSRSKRLVSASCRCRT